MTYDPDKHHRRSIRLQGYDYSRAGAYFVTICTQNRQCLFGDIVDGGMVLNDAGQMVLTVWNEIPVYYPGIQIDSCIVMPNHMHGIVVISNNLSPNADTVGATPCGCHDVTVGCPDINHGFGQAQGPAPTMSLPDVVHRFKTMTTQRYARGVKCFDWPPFPGKLWQRNYYEHIVRLSACGNAQAGNENELNRIRQYIADNPAKWDTDRENPNAVQPAATIKKKIGELGV